MASRPLALRVLEQRHIAHQVVTFDPAIRDAGEVARATGHAPESVYKTLVVEHDPPKGKPLLVMAPSDTEVNLKVLAASIGAKKLRMASHRDAERYTGLRVGGISALALLDRRFPAYIDVRALALDTILVSAGERGMDLCLAVADLVTLTGAAAVRLD